MPLPTYADTIPAILQWAIARDLIHPDGSANLATPWGQHAKTVEEIGEAANALGALNAAREAGRITDENDTLALELGDVLVTLVLQASMQGVSFEQCRFESGRLGCGYGSDWYLGKIVDAPLTWDYIKYHSSMVGSELPSDNANAYIGAVVLCVEEIARVELSLLGPEVMALALAEINKEIPVNA